jgi:SAM-dependent methyltransferase
MDRTFTTVVEVGCSRGALARVYRTEHPETHYVGLEIDPENARLARVHCTRVISGDVENLSQAEWESLFPSDCWVFGDSLEHLCDPWALLSRVRRHIGPAGQVVACIPNAQHWSLQARLATGNLRYEEQGLLDRTHLRWFTRITMIELFESTGFRIVKMFPRIFHEPGREFFLPAIRALAAAVSGVDADTAVRDAMALQYVIKAVPE